MPKTLYICYFGVREPLVQTQVLPYLRELKKGRYADGDLKISILTFEPDPLPDSDTIRSRLADDGIDWQWLPYHKRFSVIATAWDIFRGTLFVREFIARERPDILHGRVHVPTLMGALARKLSRHKPRLLFDIRGFFPEEYTDAGVWPKGGLLYRIAKSVERWLLKESDGFVVLTEKARDILFPESKENGRDGSGRPVEVIPCCVDLSRFNSANLESRTQVRSEYGLGNRFVVAYVGAFGGWYLTEEMVDFFRTVKNRRSDAFVLMLTQSKSEAIEPMLLASGYSPDDYWIGRVQSDQIPSHLSAADFGVSLIKPCYSKQASSPTKNAEYLACGLPIVANDGVGDTTEQITEDSTGVILRAFDTASYNEALDQLEVLLREGATLASRCRESAERRFDLERVGGERYRRLYSRLRHK